MREKEQEVQKKALKLKRAKLQKKLSSFSQGPLQNQLCANMLQ